MVIRNMISFVHQNVTVTLKRMNRYTAIHFNGSDTTFTPAATIEAARTHLITLINTQQASTHDTMSIVETTQDRVIYFQKHNTIERLSAINQPTTPFLQQLNQYIQQTLNLLSPTVR